MKLPAFTYHRPDSLQEALAVLAEHEEAKVVAGGQSLLPMMALRLARPEHLVDISRLPELSSIRECDGGIAIGAAVTHATAERSPLVTTGSPMLAAALPLIGHQAIRNRGTVCGSLAHADAAAELPAVALALDATLVATSPRGERTLTPAEFFEGYLSTALEPDELLTEVRLPAWPASATTAVHELSRRHGDFALVGIAAMVTTAEDGTVASAALSFFGAASVPCRVAEAEASLVGRQPNEETIAEAAAIVSARLAPPDDIHASRAYRQHAAGVLTRRALAEATTNGKMAAA
ncbi:MAG: xanthine dehydrogenase family protein subunit M [Actinobacteria bacterium]|nr:xanthine dehydrogenase family protein subunit M [Actinomycetota bacterium]